MPADLKNQIADQLDRMEIDLESQKTAENQDLTNEIRAEFTEKINRICRENILSPSSEYFLQQCIDESRLNNTPIRNIQALTRSDIFRLYQTECLFSIMDNHRWELERIDGSTLPVFVGKDIHRGIAYGIANAAFVLNENEGFTVGALKTINDRYAKSPEARKVFETEKNAAIAHKQWKNPNIIETHSIGQRHIIFETAPNATDLYRAMNRIGMKQAVSAFSQIKNAIDEYRKRKVFHGDIKPGNIMLFGKTAKLIDNATNPPGLANTGDYSCTPFYHMSRQALLTAENILIWDRDMSIQEAKIHLAGAIDMYNLISTLKEILAKPALRAIEGLTEIDGLSKEDKSKLQMYSVRQNTYLDRFSLTAWLSGQAQPTPEPYFPFTSNPVLEQIAAVCEKKDKLTVIGTQKFYEEFWKAVEDLESLLKQST